MRHGIDDRLRAGDGTQTLAPCRAGSAGVKVGNCNARNRSSIARGQRLHMGLHGAHVVTGQIIQRLRQHINRRMRRIAAGEAHRVGAQRRRNVVAAMAGADGMPAGEAGVQRGLTRAIPERDGDAGDAQHPFIASGKSEIGDGGFDRQIAGRLGEIDDQQRADFVRQSAVTRARS